MLKFNVIILNATLYVAYLLGFQLLISLLPLLCNWFIWYWWLAFSVGYIINIKLIFPHLGNVSACVSFG